METPTKWPPISVSFFFHSLRCTLQWILSHQSYIHCVAWHVVWLWCVAHAHCMLYWTFLLCVRWDDSECCLLMEMEQYTKAVVSLEHYYNGTFKSKQQQQQQQQHSEHCFQVIRMIARAHDRLKQYKAATNWYSQLLNAIKDKSYKKTKAKLQKKTRRSRSNSAAKSRRNQGRTISAEQNKRRTVDLLQNDDIYEGILEFVQCLCAQDCYKKASRVLSTLKSIAVQCGLEGTVYM